MRNDGVSDSLAPWIGRARYTLSEAAHLCAGVAPGYPFPAARNLTDADRTKVAEVRGWLDRLETEASGALADSITRHPPQYKWVEAFDRKNYRVESAPGWTEVNADGLVAWLDSIGVKPAVLFAGRADRRPEGSGNELSAPMEPQRMRELANTRWAKPKNKVKKEKAFELWKDRQEGRRPDLAKIQDFAKEIERLELAAFSTAIVWERNWRNSWKAGGSK